MSETADPVDGAVHRVSFPLKLFSSDTVKKAALRFTDRCAFDLSIDQDSTVCKFRLPPGMASSEAVEIAAALRREVLDQDLRESVATETRDVRNAILAYAFSRTGLQRDEQV